MGGDSASIHPSHRPNRGSVGLLEMEGEGGEGDRLAAELAQAPEIFHRDHVVGKKDVVDGESRAVHGVHAHGVHPDAFQAQRGGVPGSGKGENRESPK